MKRILHLDDHLADPDDEASSLLGSPLLGATRIESDSSWNLDSLFSPRLAFNEATNEGLDEAPLLLETKESFSVDSDNLEEEMEEDEPQSSASGPPRFALDYESHLETANAYLAIVQQPPREVRTRKKKEKRPFCVKAIVKAPSQLDSRKRVASCRLVFADDLTPVVEETECNQRVEVGPEETTVSFDGLGIVNPSLKWKDREVCLEIAIENLPQSRLYTRRIYSYSNLGVLQRRRDVQVAGLSARLGSMSGGMRMHLVGKPFFKSDRLKVVFRIFCARSNRWVTLDALNLEHYSESVLFFTTPRLPSALLTECGDSVSEVKAFIQATNDGTNFSNGMEFAFRSAPRAIMFQNKRPRSDDELQQARL